MGLNGVVKMQTLTTYTDRIAPVISIRNLDLIVADIVNQLFRHSLVNILLPTFTSANVAKLNDHAIPITQLHHTRRPRITNIWQISRNSYVYIVRACRTWRQAIFYCTNASHQKLNLSTWHNDKKVLGTGMTSFEYFLKHPLSNQNFPLILI